MIEPKAIDHVCLWVSSLERAKNYYKKIFGMHCTARGNHDDSLVVESSHVHFFIRQHPDANAPLHEQHLALEVESLDRVVAALESLGVRDFETGEVSCFKRRNYRWCEWRDPDGIRLECVELLPD